MKNALWFISVVVYTAIVAAAAMFTVTGSRDTISGFIYGFFVALALVGVYVTVREIGNGD